MAEISVCPSAAGVRGVIFDWGGVLTKPIADSVRDWLRRDRIDRDSYVKVMRSWFDQAYGADQTESPVHGLERGEVADTEFETLLASLLVTETGSAVPAAGLLRRMFAGSELVDDMIELVRELRSDGLRTGLLSNSWGDIRKAYPAELLRELFGDAVISGQVGMRKPEQRIFLFAADRLGLPPASCVFVDDIEANIVAARELGFVTVHHRDPGQTRAELTRILQANPAS